MKKVYFIIFLVSLGFNCRNGSLKNNDRLFFNRFKQIDIKLNKAAEKLNTKVAAGGGGFGFDEIKVPDEKFELRRILWIDGDIGKGMIIEPNYEDRKVDSPAWNFVNIAWLVQNSSDKTGTPFWTKNLMQKSKLEEIEKNIDQLISRSLENLHAVKRSDLKFDN